MQRKAKHPARLRPGTIILALRNLVIVSTGFLTTSVAVAQNYMNDANTRTPPRQSGLPAINDGFPRTFVHEFEGKASALEYSKYHFIDAKGLYYRRVEAIQSSLSPQTKMLRHISGRAYQSYVYSRCSISGGVAFESTTPFSQGGPRTTGCGMYAGHWLYKAGATLTAPVNAGGKVLKVSNPARFTQGQYVVIYDKPAGSFRNAEHARINSVNRGAKTITVTRGYKSQPKGHGAGAIVAQHVLGQGHDPRLWAYNLSTKSPRDAKGKTFGQFYAEWLRQNLTRYKHGSRTSANVAGIVFDADFYFEPRIHQTDANNDLVVDDAIGHNGENWQGKGMDDFYARVRANLPGKYIVTGLHNGRGYKSAHGGQMETWLDFGNGDFTPNPKYQQLDDLFHNYLYSISEHDRGPALVHNLTKTPTREYPARSRGVAKSNAPARLGLAMTLMEDGYFGTHSIVSKDAWWDEYAVYTNRGSSNFGKAVPKGNVAAIRQNRGWLGQPQGKFKRIFNQANFQPARSIINNGTFDGGIGGWKGQNVALSRSSNAQDGSGSLQASGMLSYKKDLGGATIKSSLMNFSARQPYTVAFSLRSNTHREVRVSFGNDWARLPVSPRWRRYVITLTPTSGSRSALTFAVGKESAPLWVDSVYLFRGDANVFQREFKNGLALANATSSPKTINVGSGYRRIGGIQDRAINNGQVVQQVTLPPYDGLLLIKTNASNPGGSGGGGGGGGGGAPPTGGGNIGGGKASIGSIVWRDNNRNGIRVNSEPGLAGVRVQLQRCNGANLASTRSNANGRYRFSKLKPGSYRLKFFKPSGMRFSPLRRGKNKSRDSNAQPSNGTTHCMNIKRNDQRLNIDAGLSF